MERTFVICFIPNCVINQVEQKHKQENKIEITKQSGESTSEIKKHLLLPYHDKKSSWSYQIYEKCIKFFLPTMVTTQITFTDRNVCFNIKDD